MSLDPGITPHSSERQRLGDKKLAMEIGVKVTIDSVVPTCLDGGQKQG